MSPSIEQLHTAHACWNLSSPDHSLVRESSVTEGFGPFFKNWQTHQTEIMNYVRYVYGVWQVLLP